MQTSEKDFKFFMQMAALKKKVVNGREVYSLSKIAQDENSHLQSECRRRDNQILQHLFKTAKGGFQAYEKAFYDLLGSVFSSLTEIYVQSITLNGKKSVQNQVVRLFPLTVTETA